MKKVILILAALLLAAPAFTSAAAVPGLKKEKKAKAPAQTVCFSSNLDCANCVKKVTENISYVKGVKALDVSLESNTITVGYDPGKTNEETLAAEIRKLGYTAEKVKKQ